MERTKNWVLSRHNWWLVAGFIVLALTLALGIYARITETQDSLNNCCGYVPASYTIVTGTHTSL